jgi:hypothetical protein
VSSVAQDGWSGEAARHLRDDGAGGFERALGIVLNGLEEARSGR